MSSADSPTPREPTKRADGDATASRNRVLSALSPDQFERLRPHLEPFELHAGAVLAHAGSPLTHVYFVESGLVSLVASTAGGATVEVASVGNEGMVGAVSLLGGGPLPFGVIVHLPGRAMRLRVDALKDAIMGRGEMLVALHHYVQILVAQITQTAVCNRFHSPRQRLSRWLAHTFDRVASDAIPLTHEFIAQMVGGARSLVSQACADLRRLGVIDYHRGRLRVRDRTRLREQACECYRTVRTMVEDERP